MNRTSGAAVALAWLGTATLPGQTPVTGKATIPLCPGLTIVTAISQPQGDYESIKRIESVTAEGVRIRYSSYMPDPCCESSGGPLDPPWVPFVVHRTVRKADLESSTTYLQQFVSKGVPETVKGTTARGISSKAFRGLRDTGKTPLTVYMAIPPGIGLKEDGSAAWFGVDYRMPGELAHVDPTPVMLSILVNDRMTQLPALRARGKLQADESEFYFLFDEANPISLEFRVGLAQPMPPEFQEALKEAARSGGECRGCAEIRRMFEDRDVLRVVKITHKCEAPALAMKPGGGGAPPGGGRSGGIGGGGLGGGAGTGDAAARLEESLEKTGRAEVYSIYFAFNSDEIREESEPTLQDIADILRRHPDWKLSIEGHTDSIGDDAYNLQLSRRRFAAVRAALVSTKGIAGARLVTGGFGESRPNDTNDTVEGRARNRRVELVRVP